MGKTKLSSLQRVGRGPDFATGQKAKRSTKGRRPKKKTKGGITRKSYEKTKLFSFQKVGRGPDSAHGYKTKKIESRSNFCELRRAGGGEDDRNLHYGFYAGGGRKVDNEDAIRLQEEGTATKTRRGEKLRRW